MTSPASICSKLIQYGKLKQPTLDVSDLSSANQYFYLRPVEMIHPKPGSKNASSDVEGPFSKQATGLTRHIRSKTCNNQPCLCRRFVVRKPVLLLVEDAPRDWLKNNASSDVEGPFSKEATGLMRHILWSCRLSSLSVLLDVHRDRGDCWGLELVQLVFYTAPQL